LSFLVVSPFVSKLREFEKIRAVNTFATASTTTKLRVVFNGSAKTDSRESLNDILHAGPKVQTDLVDVILGWRLHAFVFSADIEKMYRQVLLHPADRGYQRILRSEDPQEPPLTYQLNTVTFGLTCAPFQANRVLRQLAIDEGQRFPLAANVIPGEFYVDDCLSGAETIEAARERASQVDKLLSAGGFHLHKWASNCEEVLSGIEESRCQNLSKIFEEGPMLRALGISWNPVSDAFVLTARQDAAVTPTLTKRAILSTVAKLFDPLGWLAPIIIVAKPFLQSLWRSPLGWDDRLPDNMAAEWMGFSDFLGSTFMFSIPRWVQTTPSSVVEFHGFSDASESALVAVVYFRLLKENLDASTSLLMVKTKVAPLKCVTIARLELSAAVLLVRLVQRCLSALHLMEVPVHLWTDSSVALTWISGHPSRWRDFVRNRVSFIQETVPRARWHHVPGHQNPADVASRETSPQQLRQHSLWWGGPDWLSSPSPSWPSRLPNLPLE